MKRVVFIIAISLVAMGAISCDSREKLSASTAKSLLADELLKNEQTIIPFSVKLGYYEENDENVRNKLRKLAANELITYKAEKIEWQERYVKDWYYESYWTMKKKYVYGTRTNQAVFVTAELTSKGKKYLYAGPEPYSKPKDKYENEVDDRDYPEDTVSVVERFPGDVVPEKQQQSKEESNSAQVKTPSSENASTAEKEKSEYQIAKEKENISEREFIGCKLRVAGARRIQVDNGEASCEYIVEVYDVTPFGRICNGLSKSYITGKRANFIYYQDMGWVYLNK